MMGENDTSTSGANAMSTNKIPLEVSFASQSSQETGEKQPASSLPMAIADESTTTTGMTAASLFGDESREEPQEAERFKQMLYILQKCVDSSKEQVDCHEVVRRSYGASIEIFNLVENGNPDSGVDMIAKLLEIKLSEVNRQVMNGFREKLVELGMNAKLLHLESTLETYKRKRSDREESEHWQKAKSMRICEAVTESVLSNAGISVADIVKCEVLGVKNKELLLLKQELTHAGVENSFLESSNALDRITVQFQGNYLEAVNEGMASAADPSTITV
jgi:hypothetical protein